MEVYMENKSDARKTYEMLCNTLDGIKWHYQRDDEHMVVTTSAVGEDLTIRLRIVVSEQRNLMYVKSPMPYKVPESARAIVSSAVNVANYSMLNGCFEYDMRSGYLAFRAVVPFEGSIISDKVCKYLVMLACQMVDKFNDKFLSLAKGNMTLEEFEKYALKE